MWAEPSRFDRLERDQRCDPVAVSRLWAQGVVMGLGSGPSVEVEPEQSDDSPWLIDGPRAWRSATTAFAGVAHLVTRPTTGLAFAPDRHLLLGLADGTACFVDRLDYPVGLDLRRALPLLEPAQAEMVVAAAALVAWHEDAGFCPTCGCATRITAAGASRRCDRCSLDLFPRTDPAVIVAVTDDQDRLLLVHQPHWRPGQFSVLAGFVEAGESVEQAVYREIAEEVGVALDGLHYVASQPWPLPRSLMLGFRAHAVTTRLHPDGSEIVEAAWFDRGQVAEAVASGQLLLPGPASIAYRLITGWLDGPQSRPASP